MTVSRDGAPLLWALRAYLVEGGSFTAELYSGLYEGLRPELSRLQRSRAAGRQPDVVGEECLEELFHEAFVEATLFDDKARQALVAFIDRADGPVITDRALLNYLLRTLGQDRIDDKRARARRQGDQRAQLWGKVKELLRKEVKRPRSPIHETREGWFAARSRGTPPPFHTGTPAHSDALDSALEAIPVVEKKYDDTRKKLSRIASDEDVLSTLVAVLQAVPFQLDIEALRDAVEDRLTGALTVALTFSESTQDEDGHAADPAWDTLRAKDISAEEHQAITTVDRARMEKLAQEFVGSIPPRRKLLLAIHVLPSFDSTGRGPTLEETRQAMAAQGHALAKSTVADDVAKINQDLRRFLVRKVLAEGLDKEEAEGDRFMRELLERIVAITKRP